MLNRREFIILLPLIAGFLIFSAEGSLHDDRGGRFTFRDRHTTDPPTKTTTTTITTTTTTTTTLGWIDSIIQKVSSLDLFSRFEGDLLSTGEPRRVQEADLIDTFTTENAWTTESISDNFEGTGATQPPTVPPEVTEASTAPPEETETATGAPEGTEKSIRTRDRDRNRLGDRIRVILPDGLLVRESSLPEALVLVDQLLTLLPDADRMTLNRNTTLSAVHAEDGERLVYVPLPDVLELRGESLDLFRSLRHRLSHIDTRNHDDGPTASVTTAPPPPATNVRRVLKTDEGDTDQFITSNAVGNILQFFRNSRETDKSGEGPTVSRQEAGNGGLAPLIEKFVEILTGGGEHDVGETTVSTSPPGAVSSAASPLWEWDFKNGGILSSGQLLSHFDNGTRREQI